MQRVRDLRLDCDSDVLLLQVEQVGGIACHTGRYNCFFQKLVNEKWEIDESAIKDPAEIYSK